MDTEMNFEISRIKTEVIHLQQNGVLEYGEHYVIFTIPESIIELLPTDKQGRAKDEVSILKKIYEAEYQ